MPLEPWQLNFAKTIEVHRAQGLGWRYDGIDDWSTESIFQKLRELGVDTDADRFREQATAAGRQKPLDDDWDNQLSDEHKHTGFWSDFVMFAVPVLWERLTPDLVCPELIDERLHRVIKAEEDKKPLPDVDGMPADVAGAWELARYLQGFAVSERAAQFEEIVERSYYDYAEWLQDLIENRGPEYPDVATQIADVISDCCHARRFQAELAIALAVAGRRDEAISRARANMERFPEDIWVRILAGDVFEQLNDDEQGIRVWVEALPAAKEHYDWEGAIERIEAAFIRTGRGRELEALVQSHPCPAAPPPPPAPRPAPPQAIIDLPPGFPSQFDIDVQPLEQLTSARKVGRNDPCPCGSGMKYKKCCMP